MVLLLCAPPADWTEKHAGVVAPLSGYPFYKHIEAAGEAHLELAMLRSKGIYHDVAKEETNESEQEVQERSGTNSDPIVEEPKPVQEITVDMDHYEILGLDHLRWKATEKDIKKAYRKMILSHHPDKQAQASNEIDDEVFKSINLAHDVLSNPEKRRVFDSKDYFDNTIPSEKEAQNSDFFELFAPVFESNQKWSISEDVPSIGAAGDDITEVLKFYEFWRNFKSWRDFSGGEEEFDLEDAECREEKRWMERQNKKLQKQMKKDEHARIMSLVDLAEKYDPRVIAWKEEQEQEKIRKKEERKAFKLRKREEKTRAAREEQERKLAEAKRKEQQEEEERKQQVFNNKQIRKKRPQLRKLCRQAREKYEENSKRYSFYPKDEHVEILCKVMKLEQFNLLIDELSSGTEGPYKFREILIEYQVIPEDDPYFEEPVIEESDEEEKKSDVEDDYEPDKDSEGEEVTSKNIKESESTQAKKESKKESKKEEKKETIVKQVVTTEEPTQSKIGPDGWSSEEQKLLELAM